MKIRRIVATASAMANARIIHSRCKAIRLARTWTKPLIRAKRKKVAKVPMYTFSIQPEKGITNLMNRAVAPTTRPIETSALPTQRVAEVSGPAPPDELKRRQGQVESAQDHVQSYDCREVQEAGVEEFIEVVGGGRRDADERQEADRRANGTPHDISHHRTAPLPRSSRWPGRPVGAVSAEGWIGGWRSTVRLEGMGRSCQSDPARGGPSPWRGL
jgi:hypothetical protein